MNLLTAMKPIAVSLLEMITSEPPAVSSIIGFFVVPLCHRLVPPDNQTC